MRKVLIGLVAGQALQLLLQWITASITYTEQGFWYCLGIGMIVLVAFVCGAWPQLMFAPGVDVEVEEAPPLPDDLKVMNDRLKRDDDVKVVPRPPKKTWGSRIADAIEADKKTTEPSVMEQKLSEVGKDV